MVANYDSSVIYDDYSCLQKVTCPQATTYGVIFQTTGRAQTGPIKQDRHQRSQEITEE